MPAAVVDLPGLVADAEERLLELRPQLERLAFEALTDLSAASELADVRAAISSCEATLEQAGWARAEQGRRAAAERERLAGEEKAAAMTRARELQAQIEGAYGEWDAHVAELGDLTRGLLGLWHAQDAQLEVTGRRPAQNRAQARWIALNLAFRASIGGLPRAVLELDGLQLSKPVSLVDGGFRPVAPLSDDEGN
jgi:hypothetical protein